MFSMNWKADAEPAWSTVLNNKQNKSPTVAEMVDRGHNRQGPKRVGGGLLCPFQVGAGSPSNNVACMGWGLLPYQVASSSIQPLGHNRHWPKIGWGCALFLGGDGSLSNTVTWAKAYLHTKWHLSSSSHMARTDTGQKLGGSVPLMEWSWVPI